MRLICQTIFLLLVIPAGLFSQARTDSMLAKLLASNQHPIVQQVLKDPQKYRVQVIYTEINRDKSNQPFFRNHYYNYDPGMYYNPASTVKLPLALLALEKINMMKLDGIDKFTPMQFDSIYPRQTTAHHDSTAQNKFPCVGHYIRKAFLVSDNDAYNRLYQFVGQGTIHKQLYKKGYSGIRIPRQFMGYTEDQHRRSNPVRFIKEDGTVIYKIDGTYNPDSIHFPKSIKIGKGYLDRNDVLVNEPFDFARHNYIPLEDLQQILQSVMFPLSVPAYKRFFLTSTDYKFVRQYLSQFPSETPYPKYDDSTFYNSYVKFFFRDSTRKMPPDVRVFNKVGWAYGFLTDVSYIVDLKNNIEFMLTATIYVNEDGILNDNKYDYDDIGYPFLNKIGQTIYQYELKRPRSRRPALIDFKVQYEKRDPNDTRPCIKVVDN